MKNMYRWGMAIITGLPSACLILILMSYIFKFKLSDVGVLIFLGILFIVLTIFYYFGLKYLEEKTDN